MKMSFQFMRVLTTPACIAGPQTGLLYIPINRSCLNQTANDRSATGTGPRFTVPEPGLEEDGDLTELRAVDISTGREVWSYSQRAPKRRFGAGDRQRVPSASRWGRSCLRRMSVACVCRARDPRPASSAAPPHRLVPPPPVGHLGNVGGGGRAGLPKASRV